ncbi:MAG: hypothetical protein LCH88_02065 [Proteobacteria bacterium]|nr:hypothetical protein [Pseudomonadota bacterium]
MRALVPALLAAFLLAAPVAAQETCAPSHLDRFKADAMVADADMRAEAQAALEACAAFAQEQQRNAGEIEERVLAQVAALAGRTAYAAYAADDIPHASPALIGLLVTSFRALYPHLRALPEDENAAAMRTIVFHLVEQAGPRATGSIRTPQTEGSRP